MAEKLTEQLTIAWSGKIMDVMTTDGTIDATSSGKTFSNVQSILNNEIRFTCTVSDNYEIDTVTNTNEHFVVKCITDSSFIYTWADPTYITDIIDTITITTRAIGDTPTVTKSNTNLNITTLANTKWEFTLYPTYNIELLWDCLPSYPEYGYSIYSLNTKWDGTDYGGIYFYTGRPDVYDDIYLYEISTNTWYGPRTIEITDGDHVTDPDVIEFFKSQATLISNDSSSNVTDLTGTTWKFNDTISDYSIIELVSTFPGDYWEDSDTLFNISYTFDGVNYNCLHIVPADASGAEPWDGNMIYYPGWNTTVREITFIGGNDATDENLLNFIKSNATLVSGGDSGESGDEPEGGDEPSTPTIGPNAQLTEFLTGIADALREKKGTSDLINPQNFAQEITDLSTGGGGDLLTQAIEGTIIAFNSPELSMLGSYAFYQNPNLMVVDLPKCNSIGSFAFNGCSNIIDISLPKCTQVGNNAFYSCNGLTKLDLPECTSIGASAFQYCTNMSEINLPKCTYINASAFASCLTLINVSLPECLSLSNGVFSSCSKLTFISLPKCLSIGDQAFFQCYALSSVYMPNVTSLKAIFPYCSGFKEFTAPNVLSVYGTFLACPNLSSVVLPKCTHIGTQTFQNCQSLTYISLPECVYVGDYAFANCSKLSEIRLPKCSSIGYSAFSYCSGLKAVYLDVCSRIERFAFTYCSKLESLYLLSTSVCSLGQYTAFNYTPISNSTYLGYFGSIYVPASLLTAYQTNTAWSMFKSRFVGV